MADAFNLLERMRDQDYCPKNTCTASSSSVSFRSDYNDFCNKFPLMRISVASPPGVWAYHEVFPSPSDLPEDELRLSLENPIVFLHDLAGTCAVFYNQIRALGKKGFSVISCQYPEFKRLSDFAESFDSFLDSVLSSARTAKIFPFRTLKRTTIHLVGAGLGGFLAQYFCNQQPQRVASIVLINSYIKNISSGAQPITSLYKYFPHAALKQMIEERSFPTVYEAQKGPLNLFSSFGCAGPRNGCGPRKPSTSVLSAVNFMSNQLDLVPATQLLSRLRVVLGSEGTKHVPLRSSAVTLIQSMDCSQDPSMTAMLLNEYRKSKVAHLREAGDLPYLTAGDEVSMHVEVHMRNQEVFPGRRQLEAQNSLPSPSRRGSWQGGPMKCGNEFAVKWNTRDGENETTARGRKGQSFDESSSSPTTNQFYATSNQFNCKQPPCARDANYGCHNASSDHPSRYSTSTAEHTPCSDTGGGFNHSPCNYGPGGSTDGFFGGAIEDSPPTFVGRNNWGSQFNDAVYRDKRF